MEKQWKSGLKAIQHKKIQDSLAQIKRENEFVHIIFNKFKDHRVLLTSVELLHLFVKGCSDQDRKKYLRQGIKFEKAANGKTVKREQKFAKLAAVLFINCQET